MKSLAVLGLLIGCGRPVHWLEPPASGRGAQIVQVTRDEETREIRLLDLASGPTRLDVREGDRVEAFIFPRTPAQLGIDDGWTFSPGVGRVPNPEEYALFTTEFSEDGFSKWKSVEDDSVQAPRLPVDGCGGRCPSDRTCIEQMCAEAVVDLDAGEDFACARWSSGRVSCWGANESGAVGRSERDVFLATSAELVPGVEGAEELSATAYQACVRSAGSISCWGHDHQGVHFDPPQPPSILGVPREIAGVENAIDLSVGGSHTCVVTAEAKVRCWGANGLGQLGDGTTSAAVLPIEAAGVDEVVEVASGRSHTCARDREARVSCWGSDDEGQLGMEIDATSLVAGADHSCIVDRRGDVRCWGGNQSAQLGGGDVRLSGRATSIDLGPTTGCAVLESGDVECWGSSRHGELGGLLPYPYTSGLPHAAPARSPAVDVAVGGTFACALSEDRITRCWGSNRFGQLGNGSTGIVEERRVSLPMKVTKMAAGFQMTCALLESGPIRCWGHNGSGQLGRGWVSAFDVAGDVLIAEPIVDLAAGYGHACAIVEGGNVLCWGANNYGQAVPGAGVNIDRPTLVVGGAIDLALGDLHSCAVLATGAVSCWGLNGDHDGLTPVGHGNHGEARPAELVPGISDAIQGDAGYDQTCVLRADRSVTCWGRAGGFTDVDAVAVGAYHTCALSAGTVLCSGFNLDGELGDGTFVARSDPRPVVGISDARSLMIGAWHTCAVRESGELWCWGRNHTAQLGQGWPAATPTPVPVEGLAGVTTGDAFDHTCVAVEDRVECWGWNEWGQVDPETLPIELEPSRVRGLEPIF